MLCGQPAFSGASIPEVVFKVVYEQPPPLIAQVPTLPPTIVTAVMQAMAKPLDERFANVTLFVEAMTGQPLTLPRGQLPGAPLAADSPSAARRVATGEAFARTMGSGDHGESPVNPLLATAAPGSATAPGAGPLGAGTAPGAATTPGGWSGAGAPVVTASRAAPTVDLGTGRPAAPRRRRSAGLIAAIAIAAAAIAGVAVYLAVRPGPSPSQGVPVAATDPSTHTTPSNTGAGSTATPPTMTDTPNPTPTAGTAKNTDARDAGSGTAEPVTTDARVPDRQPDKPIRKPDPRKPGSTLEPRPVVSPDDGDEPDDADDSVRERLRDAAAALDRQDYDRAERLAKSVINSPASPRAHAQAHLIHGKVQCIARNDQEAFGIDLRRLTRFPAIRAKLLGACRSRGMLTAP
jgi:eukaryotic-like serine/threonine-protein kinase